MPLSFRLAWFYFAFFVYAGAFVAYFPPFLASRGLGPAEIAWVLALPHLARMAAPAAWGWIADRSGAHRGIVVFSCAVNVSFFAVLPYIDGLSAMAWLVGVASLLSSAALPLVEVITLGALASQPGRYGPIRLWGSIGFVAAVMAVGAWLDYRPVDTLPAVLLVSSLLTLGAALTLPVQRVSAAPPSSGLIMTSQARMLIGAGFCMTVAHGALYAFLTLFLQAEGYSGSVIGLLWTVGVLAEVAVFFYLPALFRRYSLGTLLLASFAIAVLRFLVIGWGASLFWLLLAAQLMHAATFGSFHAASVAAVRRVFPEHAQGRGQTLFSSLSYGAGGAVGALLAGWTWAAAGPELAFSVSSLAALVGFFLTLRLKRSGF